MVQNVKNIPLNAQNCTRIAERVMKDRLMRVDHKFAQSSSSVYSIPVKPGKRIQMLLSDNYFGYSEICKKGLKWDVTKEYHINGTLEMVEEAFFKAVKNLVKMTGRSI